MMAPSMPRLLKTSLLSSSLLLCVCAFLVADKLRSHSPPPAPHDLFAIVNQQLTAFRAADFRNAYRQAATGVQQKFTLTQFEKMIRQRYPEIMRERRIEFGLVRLEGENAFVQVFFFAADGTARSFLFSLINEEDAWKIDGVEEVGSGRWPETLTGTHA